MAIPKLWLPPGEKPVEQFRQRQRITRFLVALSVVVLPIGGWLWIAQRGQAGHPLLRLPSPSASRGVPAPADLAGLRPPPRRVETNLGLLQRVFVYQERGLLDEAEWLCWEVIHATRDPEEVAVAYELLLSIRHAKFIAGASAPPVKTPSFSPPSVGGPVAPPDSSSPPTSLAPVVPEGTPLLGAPPPAAAWFESSLPLFFTAFTERLTDHLELVGERAITRKMTEAELRQIVVPRVLARFPQQVTHPVVHIHPDGIVGSAMLHLGPVEVPLRCRVGVTVVNDRPRVALHELAISRVPLPRMVLGAMEQRINQRIDREPFALRVKEFRLRDGWALISVERV